MSYSTILSNFQLGNDGDINPDKINKILTNLIDNDVFVYSRFKDIPTVWKCNWYSDSRISGYSRGDFFWINTESVGEFLNNNAEEIQRIANADPRVTNKLPDWKNNNQDIYNQYYNALTGYVDDKTLPLNPIFYIGSLSAEPQLIVSQFDNNKELPENNLSAWKRFTIGDNDFNDVMRIAYNIFDEVVLSNHLKYYHFSENSSEAEISSLSNYADSDFSNVKIETNNYIDGGFKSTGFDTVEYFVRRPYPDTTVSGYTIDNQWFRTWKSGYLEHGGTISISSYLTPVKDAISVSFGWPLTGKDSNFYEIRYLGSDGKAVQIDESKEIPPGDNYLSILHILDSNDFKLYGKTTAPIYATNDYFINIIPVYENTSLPSAIPEVESYSNMGENNSISANVPNTGFFTKDLSANAFKLTYNSENTPKYMTYYVAGYFVPEEN